MSSYEEVNTQLLSLEARRSELDNQLKVIGKRLTEVVNQEKILGEVRSILDTVATLCGQSAQPVLEGIVSYGLHTIFDETEPFKVRFELKNRRMYAYLSLGPDSSILDSRGGGYVDLISVLFVVVLLLREQPALERLLVLDESFSEVGAEHLEKVGQFLQFLVTHLGLSILLVTHKADFLSYATKVYDVSKSPEGYTKIRKEEISDAFTGRNGKEVSGSQEAGSDS